jgi:hypothetical protein
MPVSLVGGKSAIISLGLSCQTAWQLQLNQQLISDLIGEPLSVKKSLFNYTLSQPDAICDYLAAGPGQTITSEDITSNHENILFIERLKLWLMHDSKQREPEHLPVVAQKYTYLSDNFWSVQKAERRLFIVSNSQNNLRRQNIPGQREFSLREQDIHNITDAVHRAFPSGSNTVAFVCYSDRVSAPSGTYHALRPDTSVWEGDRDHWIDLYPTLLSDWIVPLDHVAERLQMAV